MKKTFYLTSDYLCTRYRDELMLFVVCTKQNLFIRSGIYELRYAGLRFARSTRNSRIPYVSARPRNTMPGLQIVAF